MSSTHPHSAPEHLPPPYPLQIPPITAVAELGQQILTHCQSHGSRWKQGYGDVLANLPVMWGEKYALWYFHNTLQVVQGTCDKWAL